MRLLAILLTLLLAACGDVEGDPHDDHHHHEHEVMTTVVLSFSDIDHGGSPMTFTWTDPENDGDPVVDSITLSHPHSYSVSVEFWNYLEDPAEDVTPEIADEDDEHQVFFTGSAVQGPATGTNADAIVEHSYTDEDDAGLPLGLTNGISTLSAGEGEFTVTLRHMPPENGEDVKTAGLADDVAESGFGAIGGANDVSVTFALEVQ